MRCNAMVPGRRSGRLGWSMRASRLGLGDRPSARLFNLMAAAAAGARVAAHVLPPLSYGRACSKSDLTGGPGAGRERALLISDLDQATKPVTRLVGVDLVAMVTGVCEHDVEPHGQFLATGQRQCPRAVSFVGGEFPVARRCAGARLGRQLSAGASRLR